MGVCGGVSCSSSASDPVTVPVLFFVDPERDKAPENAAMLVLMGDITCVYPAMEDVGEWLETRLAGLAPRRPMMPGSRWCNCGIALKRCVIKREPRRTARVATSEEAME